jgi:hypothetical protein
MVSKRSRRIRRQGHLSCPHCDQPDTSLLRLVLMGEILRADETQLVLLADVMQACGLLPLSAEAEESTAPRVQRPQGTLHTLRRPDAARQ